MQTAKVSRASRCVLLCAGLAIVTPGVSAQTPRILSLGPRTAELRETFSMVQAVRELRDGRVIVADATDRLVWICDFGNGTMTQFSRHGAGPGEYNSVSGLFAGPGDSTMLLDMGNRRVVMIDEAGRAAGERAVATSAAVGGRQLFVRAPEFADSRGVLYALALPTPRPGASLIATDSMFVVRLTGSGMDLIAAMAAPPYKVRSQTRVDGTVWTSAGPNPLAAADGWAVAPDGRVALVRSADYHVEWFTRGQRVSGQPVPVTPLPVREADKAEITNPVNLPIGAPTMQYDDWPALLPVFRSKSAIASPDGRLWVERFRTAGDDVPVLDIFDATGNAVARLTLPRRTRLVGFGRETVYIVRFDDDDLQHLERYRMPPP